MLDRDSQGWGLYVLLGLWSFLETVTKSLKEKETVADLWPTLIKKIWYVLTYVV